MITNSIIRSEWSSRRVRQPWPISVRYRTKRMLIKRLTLKKILSFNETTVELGQLNILIGANAVGKSNLIEAISLLQAPNGLEGQILRGGGVRQWLWLGDREPAQVAEIECELILTRGRQFGPLLYRLQFSDSGGFSILNEHLAKAGLAPDAEVYFDRSSNRVNFGPQVQTPSNGAQTAEVPSNRSILAQFRSPMDTTPVTEVGNHFEQIRIFREFRTGFASQARHGVSTAAPKDSLSEGTDNLALVLHQLDFLGAHDRIKEYLKRFCDRFEDVKVDVGEGLARTFLREAGLSEMVSAIRISDGRSDQRVSQTVLRSLRRREGGRGRRPGAHFLAGGRAVGDGVGHPHIRRYAEVSLSVGGAVSSQAVAARVHRGAGTGTASRRAPPGCRSAG